MTEQTSYLLHESDKGVPVVSGLNDGRVLVLEARLPGVLPHALASGPNLLQQDCKIDQVVSLIAN